VVNYTNSSGDTRIAVFRVSSNPDLADPGSEQVVLSIPQPFSNHNGGMLAFGPDGKLYIGTGDGGSGGDPQGNGQNRNSLLGKLLRVSIDDNGQLSVPPDNPFVGQAGTRGEIWSYGLRNPWRFSFDRSTGDLYLADVGQNAREEVDVAGAAQRGKGANFGWNIMEGSACYGSASCDRDGLTLPVLDYSHADGCSITGGYVYRGSAVPAVAGHYFYSDWCSGWVRSFRWTGGTATETRDWPALQPGGGVSSFGEDARGERDRITGYVV
jgi:glucose/arabinose dehydrogenase